MKIKTRTESSTLLEGVAFTDIILNVFIFFFTSFSLVYTFNPVKESKIPVKLPQAGIPDLDKQTQPIVITIDQQNLFYLDDQPLTRPELEQTLKDRLAVNAPKAVIVRADKRVIIDVAVQILDLAWSAGAKKVSLAVLEKPSSPDSKGR